jgi:hypothetical protein
MFWQCEWVCHLQLVHAPANVSAAPAQATPSKVAQPTGASTAADDGGIDSDLQARLDNLRKMWGNFQICGGNGGDILLFYKWDSPIHGWHLLWLTQFSFWHFNVWYTCSYASPSDDKTLIFVSFSSVLTNRIIKWGAAHGWIKNLLLPYESWSHLHVFHVKLASHFCMASMRSFYLQADGTNLRLCNNWCIQYAFTNCKHFS